jgi:hypothetical protein
LEEYATYKILPIELSVLFSIQGKANKSMWHHQDRQWLLHRGPPLRFSKIICPQETFVIFANALSCRLCHSSGGYVATAGSNGGSGESSAASPNLGGLPSAGSGRSQGCSGGDQVSLERVEPEYFVYGNIKATTLAFLYAKSGKGC